MKPQYERSSKLECSVNVVHHTIVIIECMRLHLSKPTYRNLGLIFIHDSMTHYDKCKCNCHASNAPWIGDYDNHDKNRAKINFLLVKQLL